MSGAKDFFSVPSGTSPFYPVSIPYSCRFDSARSCYLSKTPEVAGNRKTWTWSGWVKLGKAAGMTLFNAAPASTTQWTSFGVYDSSGALILQHYNGGNVGYKITTAVFRDPSDWYHVMAVYDASNATANDRLLIYVNGVRQAVTGTDLPLNTDCYVNATNGHEIGEYYGTSASAFLDGYLSDIYFIDGTALTPSTFGEFSTQNPNVWIPKTPTGLIYGTNGFHLDFADASVLGNDVSGNNNDYTSSGLTTADQFTDTPTNNYPTFNPLFKYSGTANGTLSEGNLKCVHSPAGNKMNFSTMPIPTTGQWYFEFKNLSTESATDKFAGGIFSEDGKYNMTMGTIIYRDSGADTTGLTALATNDIIGVAVDADALTCQMYRNNTARGPARTLTAGAIYFAAVQTGGATYTSSALLNFGATAFAYTPPTGFKALCSANLPDPDVIDSTKGFDAKLYTGTGASQNITSFNFQPDLVWLKMRNGAYEHVLVDSVRGATKVLYSAGAYPEDTTPQSVNAFLTNGFTIGTDGNANSASGSYVSWCWKKDPDLGMDIVGYTGTGANRTVAHSLGAMPEMMIVKCRDAAGQDWYVYHKNMDSSLPASYYAILNSTGARISASTPWNGTAPTGSVFSLGTASQTNYDTKLFINYLFRSVPGFSMIGSYTGNGNADGPFVYCGFRPRYVMMKNASGVEDWFVFDAVRNTYNAVDKRLYPNLNNAENTITAIDILSNGFKIRSTSHNTGTATYIFAAFAESPFKYSNAR